MINKLVFEGLLDEKVKSVHACGKDDEILYNFMYTDEVIHNSGKSHQGVLRQIGSVHCDSINIMFLNKMAILIPVDMDREEDEEMY